jgi:hypothetical protein
MFIFGVWLLGYGYYQERKKRLASARSRKEIEDEKAPPGSLTTSPVQEGEGTKETLT